MDVHCSTCGEPWDVDHLWHEIIFEAGLSPDEAAAWSSLPRVEKLSERYRTMFQAAGWAFGHSVIHVVRCPCCPKDASPDAARLTTKSALEHLFGDDEDGLAATFEDYRL